jgi:hypothetical protein
MILYAAADLIWATKIKETAKAVGVECRPVRNLEMLEARLLDSPVVALVADLDASEMVMPLIERVRRENDERRRGIRVLAWGPHVAKELFQQARDAGADEVMTRGAFDHALPEVLLQLAAGGAGAGGGA